MVECLERVEEQNVKDYDETHYYPVIIGEVFLDRYEIVVKPGYGEFSTVWLAWNRR